MIDHCRSRHRPSVLFWYSQKCVKKLFSSMKRLITFIILLVCLFLRYSCCGVLCFGSTVYCTELYKVLDLRIKLLIKIMLPR